MRFVEANVDTLVGPTYSFGGLGQGNLASAISRGARSSPRRAALQGIDKMRRLVMHGVPQFVFPPHERPALSVLRGLGFEGDDQRVLETAFREAPALLTSALSSAFTWTANWGTVTGSAECGDGLVHCTVANLSASFHRSIEAETSKRLMTQLLNQKWAIHHDALPAVFSDEGAANQMVLGVAGQPNLNIFVYGRTLDEGGRMTRRFFPRQVREAWEVIARRHSLNQEAVFYVPQSARAIDAGVFHNDVIATAHRDLLIYHEWAFDTDVDFDKNVRKKAKTIGFGVRLVAISNDMLSIEESVRTYFFNSQLVDIHRDSKRWLWVLPGECADSEGALRAIDWVRERCPEIEALEFAPVTESMANGGGPACQRLRLPLNEVELASVNPVFRATPALLDQLSLIVGHLYPDSFAVGDILDRVFRGHVQAALAGIAATMSLEGFYSFQKGSG